MNTTPFREHHLFRLMEEYGSQELPLDLFINLYFRANKALGSKDRGFIAESAYGMVRWKGLIDYFAKGNPSWQERFIVFQSLEKLNMEGLPPYVRSSFPEELFSKLVKEYGEDGAEKIARASNRPAPVTIRANALKISRNELAALLEKEHALSPTAISPTGISFHKRLNFFTLPEFKKGFFEVQDEGSQLIAGLVRAGPGDLVLDYCAGSGGKSLAVAPQMENRGQLFLHDIRRRALYEARKRLKRAGVQNGQILFPDDPKMKKLKKKMDWVLADVPCSGTGTLRRNPDMKWKYSNEMVQRLIGEQRKIFERALSFLRPEGRIIYATCSILPEENRMQADHFLKTYPVELAEEPFQSLPEEGGMDGFFGAVFKMASQL